MSKSKYIDKVNNMQQVLGELVTEANKTCKFSKRDTKLNAVRFVQILVLGWLGEPKASLNGLAQFANERGCNITDSAINERLNDSAVELLHDVLVETIQQTTNSRRIPIKKLAQFSQLSITDSVQLKLPKSLYELFAGTNGDAKAKVQVTIDYLTSNWTAMEIEAGKTSDQKSELPTSQAIAGSLNMFDLGYFKQERLQEIDKQNAYFVTRIKVKTAIYDETGTRIEPVKLLKSVKGDEIDLQILVGGRVKLPVRLVARRLSEKVAAARRRKAKKEAEDHSQTYTKETSYLLGWDILLTNLSNEQWTLTQLFDLYSIRMQIEWVFRVWKSYLNVDHFGNWRPQRVLCQLYARLIGILLCHRLTAGWLWQQGHEHSFAKCVQIIQKRVVDLLRCIARNWWGIQSWMQRLEEAFSRFGRKSKRKKDPSTLQILMDWSLS